MSDSTIDHFVGIAVRAAWLLPLLCAACSGSRPAAPPPPVAAEPELDASYDWHGLIRVPFGTLLKDIPLPLHEVLLFHEELPPAVPSPVEPENKDCHAVDGAPPRFTGRAVDSYLLCFEHDRLRRVEAAVRLPAAEAPRLFARACASWLRSAGTTAPLGNLCEGRDGNIAFSAHLTSGSDEDSGLLAITLLADGPQP